MTSVQQDGFTAFEHEAWERIVSSYKAKFGELTQQSNDALLDVLGVGAGTRFLDVATGPGYVAAVAARRGAHSAGIDFAQGMVDEARRTYSDIEFHHGSAEALPFPDGSFDAVGISFGILHFAQPEKALAEVFRVLRSGGKVAFTVWATPERAVGFGIVLKAVETYGRMDVPLPPGPPFTRFSDWSECERTLRAAGFIEPQVVEVGQTLHTRAPETSFHVMLHGAVRISALLRAQTPQARDSIEKSVLADCAPYRDGDEIRVPMPCVLASAIKP
ncbi:class I SAM-dependent methyltransferase [Paraburkholderia humisilvae]|uniref:2-methoxy-6-polyprenyl-1,4-benzoquinol methylase, mitochondrial n=1 Tax=Paraburkholderia humisilvae TaxID=627669 RepID=A0A6J5DG09_9BURK|nr:methyltransferase domain-containing protein [Paraburkholderia humisilvae]CAB3752171.1 2-methoxy-6-polyprenyl-1,4-benzoquinol methylase, mitochondrial [Paraburkholderia humisilvae]